VFVIVGPPGSGKSTQSQLLSKKYKIPSISLSDLIKDEMGKRGRLAEALKASVASGDLINDDAANDLVRTRILRADAGRGFILDGYPATAAQAKFLDGFLKENELPLPKVILLDAPDAVVTKRMLSRRRADDKPDIIESRLKEYHEEAQFLGDWYKKENVMRVDGTRPIAEVAAQIHDRIEDALAKRSFTTR
jgi:adenylate kinase